MRLALLACLVGPWPVLADCPDAGDMGRGVVVRFDDGAEAVIRRRPDGIVEWDEVLPRDAGAVMRRLLAQGFWEVEIFDVTAEGARLEDGHQVWHYPVEAGELPQPGPGLIWRGWATPEVDGRAHRSDWLDVTSQPGEPLEVGGCAFETWEVTTGLGSWSEGPRLLVTRYLPELGWGWVAEARDGEGAPALRGLRSIEALD